MQDVENIRQYLVTRIEKLTEAALMIDDGLGEADGPDWYDLATDFENDEVLERLGASTVVEIKEMRSAIRRIAAGTYGLCTVCRKPIGEKRLEAIPYAAECNDCAKS